jgi:hypothetical protein
MRVLQPSSATGTPCNTLPACFCLSSSYCEHFAQHDRPQLCSRNRTWRPGPTSSPKDSGQLPRADVLFPGVVISLGDPSGDLHQKRSLLTDTFAVSTARFWTVTVNVRFWHREGNHANRCLREGIQQRGTTGHATASSASAVRGLSESQVVVLRFGALNVFNKAQFYGRVPVDGQIEDSAFGSIESAQAPQPVQLAARFSF